MFFLLKEKKIKMDQVLVSAAMQLEKQLDSEIERLDNLGLDDIDAIREKRIKEMKMRQEKMIQWRNNVNFSSSQCGIIRIYLKPDFYFLRVMVNTQSWSMKKNSLKFPKSRKT